MFYTPQPVVSFIVRAVDDILKKDFGSKYQDGLACPVKVLDPAAGTGTFFVELIDLVHKKLIKKWLAEGHSKKETVELWNEYVEQGLLPRLFAFELMVAPYTIAQMKIALKLHETGYRPKSNAKTTVRAQ